MRQTPQRESIRKVFGDHDRPLRVDEVLELARESAPTLNQATVYRNLNRLVRDGWLVQIEFPPLGTLYERSGKPHHHHFHCRSCNTLQELPGCAVDTRQSVPPGTKVEGHELFLFGLCAACTDPI